MKTKTIVILFLAILLPAQLCSCGFLDTTASEAGRIAGSVKDKIVEWYNDIDFSAFKNGWDTVSGFIGSTYSAAISSQFIADVQNAITQFGNEMNSAYGSARGIAQEAGFAAEKWVKGTFNIDAIARGSQYSADTPNSTELGSPDVITNYGQQAQLKYYSDGSKSAQAQAETLLTAYKTYASKSKNPKSLEEYMDEHGYDYTSQADLLQSVYNGMDRIIPVDQYDEAVAYLQGRIDKLSNIEGDVAQARLESYRETLTSLKTRLTAPDGTSSKEITCEEMQAIAELSQKGEFKPEDFGITVSQAIPPKYVVKQAIGAGLLSGTIRTILTVGPDIYSIISESLKVSEVDEAALKETGLAGAISFSEGFVEGGICNVVVNLCKMGTFGEALKNASSSIIATLTFLVIEAAISGYELAAGNITAEEYGCLMIDKIMISTLALPTVALFTAILPATKICSLLGCLVGGMVACVGYTLIKNAVLEFVDGGGMEAIIPVGIKNTVHSITQKIAELNVSEMVSNLKECVVTTANNGYITIKKALE